MKTIHRARIVSLGILVCVCASCAMGPTKKFVQTAPGFEEQIAPVVHVGIIDDVCIFVDSFEDFVLMDVSLSAEKNMLQGASQYLSAKGFVVSHQSSPFVGSFLASENPVKVKTQENAKATNELPPLFIDVNETDDQYKQALVKVIRHINNSFQTEPKVGPTRAEKFKTDASIQENLHIIAEHTQCDMMLFFLCRGLIVPFGKSFTQTMTTGILTGIITGGFLTLSVHDVSYLDSQVALVDLKTGALLWSNGLRIKQPNLKSDHFYIREWPQTLIYHIPAKSK